MTDAERPAAFPAVRAQGPKPPDDSSCTAPIPRRSGLFWVRRAESLRSVRRNRRIFVYLKRIPLGAYGKRTPSENGRTRRVAPPRRTAAARPPRSLRTAARRNSPCGRLAGRLCQRTPLFRLAVRRRARGVVVPRMAPRGLRRLPFRRFQRLAAHRTAARQGYTRGLEHLPARCHVRPQAPPRIALQNPRPRPQRLARPHSGLCRARRAGRADEELHGAVLGPAAVRLVGRHVRHRPPRPTAHLRGARGDGAGAGRCGHLPRIRRCDRPSSPATATTPCS